MVDCVVEPGYNGAVSIEYIGDCGALKEGYETKDEVLKLREILVAKGLFL
jgi:hypothetical protein